MTVRIVLLDHVQHLQIHAVRASFHIVFVSRIYSDETYTYLPLTATEQWENDVQDLSHQCNQTHRRLR